MSVTDLVLWGLASGGGSGVCSYAYAKFNTVKKKKAATPVLVEGRTHDEWYDLIKPMGKEEYERLARPALDGLEESEYGWDAKRLLGDRYHDVMREWYPENYCDHCQGFTNGIPGNCFWDGPCHGYKREELNRNMEKARKRQAEIDAKSLHIGKQKAAKAIEARKLKETSTIDNVTINKFQRGNGGLVWTVKYRDKFMYLNSDEVRDFQTLKGMTPTGVLDMATRQLVTSYVLRGGTFPIEEALQVRSDRIGSLRNELLKWSDITYYTYDDYDGKTYYKYVD